MDITNIGQKFAIHFSMASEKLAVFKNMLNTIQAFSQRLALITAWVSLNGNGLLKEPSNNANTNMSRQIIPDSGRDSRSSAAPEHTQVVNERNNLREVAYKKYY